MAIASTSTYQGTCDLIITDALTKVGAVGPGRTPTGSQMTHGRRLLNDLVKSLDARGICLWRLSEYTLTTVAGTASYSLNASVLAVDEPMNFYTAGSTSRTIISPISGDDYTAIGDRTTQSRTPTLFTITKALTAAGIYQLTATFWNVPSASGDTITYRGQARGKDFVTGADTPDFPAQWVRALKLGLACDLAPDYGQSDLVLTLGPQFEAEVMAQMGSDNEQQGIHFVIGGW